MLREVCQNMPSGGSAGLIERKGAWNTFPAQRNDGWKICVGNPVQALGKGYGQLQGLCGLTSVSEMKLVLVDVVVAS